MTTDTSNNSAPPPPLKPTAFDTHDEEGDSVCRTCGEAVYLAPSLGGYTWRHWSEKYGIEGPSGHNAEPTSRRATGPPPDWVYGPLDLHDDHPDNRSRADRYKLIHEAIEDADPGHWERGRGPGRKESGREGA